MLASARGANRSRGSRQLRHRLGLEDYKDGLEAGGEVDAAGSIPKGGALENRARLE
jgi:hypothetical protein